MEKNKKTFEIKSYEGAEPVTFGLMPDEVSEKLGEVPNKIHTYPETGKIKNQYYFDGAVRVHFDSDESVDEISFAPRNEIKLIFDEKDLFDVKNPLTVLLGHDDNPLDDLGFIVFENLGVAVTGYHDRDKSQRAITIFKKGRWTDLDQAKPINLSKFLK